MKKKIIYNSAFSLVNQLTIMIVGFIIPKILLNYYGSSVNGLVASITQFLSFITLMELGVGSVVQSALYKPLAQKNNLEVSKIMTSASTFFIKISKILIIYLIFLVIFYPLITLKDFDYLYTASLIVIIGVSMFMQYYFGMIHQLLLSADQKTYIQMNVNSITLILNSLAVIYLATEGFSIHMVRLFTTLIYLVRPLYLNYYVKRHYDISAKIKLTEEPLKQKWNGIIQHIAAVVLNNTDILILTLFSSLEQVSIYSIYFNVVNGIRMLVSSLTNGMQAVLGNLYAKEEYVNLKNYFEYFEWLIHTMVVIFFGATLRLIIPFVGVYTSNITDAEYIQPFFGIIITIANGLYCIRLPYNIMVLAMGHFKETQKSAIYEVLINLIFSIVLVIKFGLVGVAIGTLIAMLYRSCYLAIYVLKKIFNRSLYGFLRQIIVDILGVLLILIATNILQFSTYSFLGWIILAIKVFLINIVIVYVINIIFYKKNTFKLINTITKRV